MKIIGIIGSRRRDSPEDFKAVCNGLRKYHIQKGRLLNQAQETLGAEYGDVLVSGGCRQGGDRFAEIIRDNYGYKLRIHLPDKSQLDSVLMKANPRAAYTRINYARNTLVAQDSDILIACVAPDRKGGTEDTIKKFCRKFDKTEAQMITEGRLILV